MADVSVQVPQSNAAHLAPGWEYDRPAPVPHWNGVKSRPIANCPTRGDRASSLNLSDFRLADLDRQYQLPAVSVVVPTRNEADNVAELVRRLERAVPSLPMEVIFVDDSTDRTPEAIEALQGHYHPEIILVHRSPEQRGDGLGGAVVRGLQIARAPLV